MGLKDIVSRHFRCQINHAIFILVNIAKLAWSEIGGRSKISNPQRLYLSTIFREGEARRVCNMKFSVKTELRLFAFMMTLDSYTSI